MVYFLQYCIFSYLTNFITGMMFAWLFLVKKEFFRVKHVFWDVTGIAGILLIFIFYKPQADIINNILFNTGIFLLMVAAFKGTFFNRFFTLPFVYVVGGMCYTIYLLHYAFLHLLLKFTASIHTGSGYLPDLILQFIIALPAILLVSGIFFLLIEKPCMDKRWPARLMEQIKHYIKPVLK
jgi:peptidoglycan/LPS O-acetylase OafA/YrhL